MVMMQIDIPKDPITQFCQKWLVVELALFGSVVRDDFGPDSDIDILITFSSSANWTLFDHVEMQDELKKILGRNVDLVTKKGIERSQNHIRRQDILDSAEVIYAVS